MGQGIQEAGAADLLVLVRIEDDPPGEPLELRRIERLEGDGADDANVRGFSLLSAARPAAARPSPDQSQHAHGFLPSGLAGRMLDDLAEDRIDPGVGIVAQELDRLGGQPGRLTMRNLLPATHPLPVDVSLPGAELAANRMALHLHGGHTPWISDGGPFSWFGTDGTYGPSAVSVPDMGIPVPGTFNYYYPNDQSARMMWYTIMPWVSRGSTPTPVSRRRMCSATLPKPA